MKKIISLMLCVLFMLSMFCLPAAAEEDDDTVYILAIGNSYSNNAVEYLTPIVYGLDKKVSVTSLYDDGCPLERHVQHYKNDAEEYEFYTDGVNVSAPNKNTMKEAFALHKFDYITIQQGPGPATTFSTYEPHLTELYKIIKKHQPQAKILIHQTWSFCELDALGNGPYWKVNYKSSLDMFNRIEESYVKAAEKIGLDPEKDIIPVGKAIQLAKDEYGFGDFYIEGENLGRIDKCANGALYNDNIDHLNARGKYIAACVWTEKVLGLDCRNTTCAEYGLFSDEETMVLRQIAHEVVTGEVQCVIGDWRAVPFENADTEQKGVKLVHYMGEVAADGVVEVPEKWGDQPIISVDETAFKYVEGVKKVKLPSTVTSYEENAFKKIEVEHYSVNESDKNKENENDNDNDKNNSWIYYVIGSAVLLAGVVAVLLILKKKSSKTDKE